jgi:hypothetical protein
MTGLTPDLRSDQRSVAAAPTAGRSIVVWCIQVESHRRQASAVDGDSSQPPHFPTLPRLTSSANRKTPTQQPHRTQQPPCAESPVARRKERLTNAMTINALICMRKTRCSEVGGYRRGHFFVGWLRRTCATDLIEYSFFEPNGNLTGLDLQSPTVGNLGQPCTILIIAGIVEDVSTVCVSNCFHEQVNRTVVPADDLVFGDGMSALFYAILNS